jgi:hypothetical protein
MDDANFAIDTANAAILALFVEEAWVQEMLQAKCVSVQQWRSVGHWRGVCMCVYVYMLFAWMCMTCNGYVR